MPTYNEARRLPGTLDQLLALAGPSSEVIFVDDGSEDGTGALLQSATSGHSNVRVLCHTRNRGKGAVVRDGIFAARGESIVFMDADLSTDLGDVAALRRALEFSDLVIGSRSLAASVVESHDYRAHMGRVFNRFTRGVSGLPYRDTQCGFKAFHAQTAKLLFALSGLNGFAFDVEILMLARRLGLRVEETPVRWKHVAGSHIRPLHDPARMTSDVLAARRAYRQNDPVAVVTVAGTGGIERLNVVRSCVRRNDVVVRDDDAVHVVLGHLCPVAVRHVIADRLVRALDCPVHSVRISAPRLMDLVQRRPRLTLAPPIERAPLGKTSTPAWVGQGSLR